MSSISKYEGPKGRSWRVQFTAPDGKRKSKQGFKTKSEAQAWAAKNEALLATGDWIDPNAGRELIQVLGDKWLVMQTHLKPSSYELNRQVWEGTVKPQWGALRVGSIKHSDVQAWVSGLGKSGSWVRHAHSVLAQVLDLAVEDRLIRKNPARGIKLPRRGKAKKVYLTMTQLRDFAAECGDREDLILLLGTSGLRWGEAVALRPVDLDPLRNRIIVSRNAAKVGNSIELGTPKTHEQRTVAVASHVMRMLVERSENLAPDALLWTGARGGWLRSPGHRTWFDGAMNRCIAKADKAIAKAKEDGQPLPPEFPRFSPHGLRHIAAGLLVESGANVKAVQRQLGHASAVMTLDQYAELFDDGLDSIAKRLDEGFIEVSEMRAK